MLTTVTPRADRRAPDPATRKPRGKSRHVIVEAKGRDAERYEWFKAFRGANIPDGPKAVGFSLSTYGDNDGSRNFPGVARKECDGEVYDPETPEKARLMYVKAFMSTSARGVWHECLTAPLDAVAGG